MSGGTGLGHPLPVLLQPTQGDDMLGVQEGAVNEGDRALQPGGPTWSGQGWRAEKLVGAAAEGSWTPPLPSQPEKQKGLGKQEVWELDFKLLTCLNAAHLNEPE